MQRLTASEIETALTDTLHRLRTARDNDNLEATEVYEAQLDRLLRWYQQATRVPVPQ
jgi:hypothetical protein